MGEAENIFGCINDLNSWINYENVLIPWWLTTIAQHQIFYFWNFESCSALKNVLHSGFSFEMFSLNIGALFESFLCLPSTFCSSLCLIFFFFQRLTASKHLNSISSQCFSQSTVDCFTHRLVFAHFSLKHKMYYSLSIFPPLLSPSLQLVQKHSSV